MFSRKNLPLTLVLLLGFFLTILSLTGICTSECEQGHRWRLFGFRFEWTGLLFFGTAGLIHYWETQKATGSPLLPLVFTAGMGAEGVFIWAQYALIGAWCPLCLVIASTVAVGTALTLYLKIPPTRGSYMKQLQYALSLPATFLLGGLLAFWGLGQVNPLHAAEEELKERLAFGNKESPIEVYLFSDWVCPACHRLEPNVQSLSETVMKRAKLFFIDHAIHPETLNFLPYHLSFILHDKEHYFALRNMLSEVSEQTKQPNDQLIEKKASELGIKYKELSFSEITLVARYYKTLVEQFNIRGTPVAVIINVSNKKGKRLKGTGQITSESVQETIDELLE